MKRRIKGYPAAHQLHEYSNENIQVRMLRLLDLLYRSDSGQLLQEINSQPRIFLFSNRVRASSLRSAKAAARDNQIQIGALMLSGYRCSGTMLVRPTIAGGRSLLGMHESLYLRTLNRGSIDKISFSACLNLDLALLYLPAGFLYNAV
jgi:hypothetical protein